MYQYGLTFLVLCKINLLCSSIVFYRYRCISYLSLNKLKALSIYNCNSHIPVNLKLGIRLKLLGLTHILTRINIDTDEWLTLN